MKPNKDWPLCPVCGKVKGGDRNPYNHRPCSRILQRRYAAENAARARKRANAAQQVSQ